MFKRDVTYVSVLAAAIAVLSPAIVVAQTATPTRLVNVDGRPMHVWTAGLDQRTPGQPVVILEAGGGATLETWTPVFADIARLAPVVAYDRRGHGKSDLDTQPQTLKRVIETLHLLLKELGTPPPYVLVGHSWGGLVIRGFSDMYAPETAGLVYLDVPDFERTREQLAEVLPPADRKEALGPPTLPEIPPDTPPGLRAAFAGMLEEMRSDYRSARAFKQPPGIPVAVVVTTRADRLKGNGGAIVRLQIKLQSEWALGNPNSLFVLAGHTGHQVHRNDPALVARLVDHVLRHVPTAPKQGQR